MIIPKLPSQHFRTFEIVAPISTHWRPAMCEEVECDAWRNGWITRVPEDSDAARYILSGASGRRFMHVRGDGAGVAEFVFEAGQKCFGADKHRVPLERQPLYIARGGDARGNPSGERRVHARPEHWVEDFAEHQARVKQSREG